MKMKFMFAAAVIAASAGLSQSADASCVADAYLGSVCYTAATYCPRQYAPADGQLLKISDYTALFAVMGCTYGGDCRETFGLPDLRGRTAAGEGQGPGLSNLKLGLKRGQEAVTLRLAEIPSHEHPATSVQIGGTPPKVVLSALTKSATKSAPADGDYLAAGRVPSSGPGSQPGFTYGTISAKDTQVTLGGIQVLEGTPGPIQTQTLAAGGSEPHDNIPPQTVLTACVATSGAFPQRN